MHQAAVERGEAATADPRLAREAELKRKQRERLGGKASSAAMLQSSSKRLGASPRGSRQWGPTEVTV